MICGMRAEFDTPAKRLKLPPRRSPYFTEVGGSRGGVSLGYRRQVNGPGSWIGKFVHAGRRVEARLGEADDLEASAESIGYRKAVAAAIEWAERQKAAHDASPDRTRRAVRTVQSAVEEYLLFRERKPAGARDARSRLTRHVLADAEFAALPLAKLRAERIEVWRSSLSRLHPVSPSTINRLLNDVRAALNAAAERYRRELPATLPIEIKVGTRAISSVGSARMQVLNDADVRRIIAASAKVDRELHNLVLVLAATGARFSQVAALRVSDLQAEAGRVMVRPSAKGRGNKARAPISVPLAADVVAALLPLTDGRAGNEPLLTTGDYVRDGKIGWRRVGCRTWRTAADATRRWQQAVRIAQLPKSTIPYALRHSSIVRGLRAGLPVRLVAALHDTSIAMIEAHYSAHIVDASEDISRRISLSISV
jgi:integrase